ncbi:MAG: hypothetical protein ACREH8_02250, partial [Opitutaceae bacterium]
MSSIQPEFLSWKGYFLTAPYGAFTVSESQLDTVQDYIRRQVEHHRHKTFAEEYPILKPALKRGPTLDCR